MSRTKGSKNKPKDPAMPTKTASATERVADVADVAESKGEVAIFSPPRLPYHPKVDEAFGIDKGAWKVLVEAIFPAAKTVDAIAMALSYCKSRNLDIMKRPVHIVPMWDSARGAYVETVWPGISELRTTASRTNGYAGCDEAQFGESVTMTFSGRVKRRGDWVDEKIEVEFPEWCRITVYRIVGGQKCKFVGPKVKWLETYATQGASELPNKMWEERAEGQLEKCFSSDTEVLTDIGFQPFSAVTGRIMQVTELGVEATDAKPFRQLYDGPMVVADGDALNFSVTPNHDMIVNYGKIEAGELYHIAKSNADYRIPLVVDGTGQGCGIERSQLILAAAIVCDGWRHNDQWAIGVSRPYKVERLAGLNKHRSRYTQHSAGQSAHIAGREVITKSDKEVFVYGRIALVTPDKLFCGDILDQLSAEESAILMDAMIEFDGNVTSTGTRRFYSSRPELMGQFERIAIQAGCSVSHRRMRHSPDAKPNYFITVSRKRSVAALSVSGNFTVRDGHRNVIRMEMANSSGEVWCCTVPSGRIIVRRRGLSMVCGNCAEAAALRRAFPEEIGNELTAEEMTGRSVHDLAVDIPAATEQTAVAGDRDTAPPRQASTAPEPGPGEDHAAGDVQDGEPPRRAPKPAEAKVDPITSGPQRAAPKDAAKMVTPIKIPGTDHTFESWAAKYVDNLKTSPDMATAYGWIDKNSDPLGRLAKGSAAVARDVKIATERVIEALRDAQEKAKDKAAKAAAKAKPAEPPPSDMGDEVGDMDGPPEPATNAPTDPEAILAAIDRELAAVESPDDLQSVWDTACAPLDAKLDFPPDQDAAQALFNKHEKRLGGD